MPIKYIPHAKNPVEGQAILNNIMRPQRVLRYRENNQVFDRIQRGMPFYEVETIETFNQKSSTKTRIEISDEDLELIEMIEMIEMIALDCENESGAWHSSSEIKIDKLGFMIKDGVKTKTFWDGKIYAAKPPKRVKIRNISGDETIVSI